MTKQPDQLDPSLLSSALDENAPCAGELIPIPLCAYSRTERCHLLPAVLSAVTLAGGWVLERHSRPERHITVLFEVQLGSIDDLYAELAHAGIEFTRAAHATLTGLCLCRLHLAPQLRGGPILTLELEVRLFPEPSVVLIPSGCALA